MQKIEKFLQQHKRNELSEAKRKKILKVIKKILGRWKKLLGTDTPDKKALEEFLQKTIDYIGIGDVEQLLSCMYSPNTNKEEFHHCQERFEEYMKETVLAHTIDRIIEENSALDWEKLRKARKQVFKIVSASITNEDIDTLRAQNTNEDKVDTIERSIKIRLYGLYGKVIINAWQSKKIHTPHLFIQNTFFSSIMDTIDKYEPEALDTLIKEEWSYRVAKNVPQSNNCREPNPILDQF